MFKKVPGLSLLQCWEATIPGWKYVAFYYDRYTRNAWWEMEYNHDGVSFSVRIDYKV